MERTLHIVKSDTAPHPWDLIALDAEKSPSCVVVLTQQAVDCRPELSCEILVLDSDPSAGKASSTYKVIDVAQLRELIWSSTSVVVW